MLFASLELSFITVAYLNQSRLRMPVVGALLTPVARVTVGGPLPRSTAVWLILINEYLVKRRLHFRDRDGGKWNKEINESNLLSSVEKSPSKYTLALIRLRKFLGASHYLRARTEV
jgi:hypothetical protein